MNVTYRIIIEPDTKGFHGYVPALKGCHTWGRSVAEAKKHLQEAIQVYLELLVAHDEKIPQDISFESFETLEVPARKKQNNRLVKKYA